MINKYRIDWYVNARDDDTYMGCNYFVGTEDDAFKWAFEHCEGFEYRVLSREHSPEYKEVQ